MNAIFVVGGVDVYVQRSGECRFYLFGINRATGKKNDLGVARWEPGGIDFDLHLPSGGALFPDGSPLLDTLVDKLDAVRSWCQTREKPDPRLGILIGDNTASR